MQTFQLAVIPGDGIGPEVTAEALKVLEAVSAGADVKFESTRYDLGAERYLATGEVLPDSVLAEIKQHDAILLGAVGGKPGDPNLPPGILERGLLLRLRFELDHYVNLRPSRIYPGASSPLAHPGEVDFVVVREGTEGPYVGNGGALRVGTPHEIATEVSVNTAFGVERVVRDAFARAAKRPRKRLTLVHKTNVLVHAGAVWSRLVDEVAQDFPDVTVDYLHIDAATIFMTTDPARFDVIVTDNLFGDIITDLAAAITGGIGLAASGNVNPDRTTPSMFEPVHGSAPDIAGQQQADPTAAILSGALLLEHLGLEDAARAVEEAVVADLAARRREWTSYLRGRRRHRRTPLLLTFGTVHLMESALEIAVSPATDPVSAERLAEILSNPGFGVHFTDHMFTVEWTPEKGWYDARVTPYAPLTLDPATAVLHYAQEIFEGMKAYRHEDGSVWTFRPEMNAERMVRSSQRLALPELPVPDFVASVDALVQADERWVPDPAGEKSLYIRPFMFASETFLGVRPSKHVTYMVIASPAGAYFAKGLKPVTIWLSEEYSRAGVGGMGAAKTGGNYASSLVAQQEAIDNGCDQVAFLDTVDRKWVEELGGMNLYFVHDDGTIVDPGAVRLDPRGDHPRLDHRAERQARPHRRGAEVLRRRVARGRRVRADHRGVRLRYGGRGHAGRNAEVARW